MKRLAVAAAMLTAAACAPATTPADPPTAPPPLARDRSQPVLALFERVLGDYFAAGSARLPTTCAQLRPAALTAQQEQALILRFVRLAPAQRCRAAGSGLVDAVTGRPAAVVQVYDFACATPDQCAGWAMVPGQPATRHALRFEGGEWRFTSDRRILGE